MILKKPYAFLVKHFRLIHGALFVGALYVLIRFFSIIDFFNTYIASNQIYAGVSGASETLINWSLSFAIVLVLILTGVVLALMIYKKKPKLFYLYTLIVYLIAFVITFILSGFIYDLQFSTPSLRLVKIIKDLLFTFAILQIPVLLMALIRTIGLDLKRFDFKKDIMDLGIEEEDNEEYVFELNLDSEDIKARIRKRIRYFKYFYKENKLLFYGAYAFILAVAVLLGIYKLIISEKIYSEGQYFDTKSLRVEVLETYKTNVDAVGNAISSNNFYLIMKIRYTNRSNSDLTVYTDNALVSYDGKGSVTPTIKYSKKLNEFGVNYYTQKLSPHETRDFVLIYEIKNEYYNSSLRLRYLYDAKVKDGKIDYKYRTVKLSPKTFSKDTKQMDTKNIGEYISFEGSPLGDTKLRVNNIKLSNTFYYSVVKCQNSKCSTQVRTIQATQNSKFDMTVMRLDFDTKYDYKTLGQGYSNSELISQYGSIRFTINGKEYNNRLALTNLTPYTTGKYIFIEVRDKLNNADEIFLDLTIRGKVYTIKLKDKEKEEEPKETE